MHAVRAVLIAIALSATAGCNVTGPVDGDIVLESPTAPVAPGSTLQLALANNTENVVVAGALPCTVSVEQRVNGKWYPTHRGDPICPAIAIIVESGARHAFATEAPALPGTYRFVTSVSEGNSSGVMVYSKPLSVVVFTY